MKILTRRIAKEIKEANHCAVYEPDLSRVWPDTGRSREAQIASFAKLHGWRLRFYKDGFCAIFDNESLPLETCRPQESTAEIQAKVNPLC